MPTPEPLPEPVARSRPAADMTPDERRRAIAELLARGIRRTLEGLPRPVEPAKPKRRPQPSGSTDAASPPIGVR